MALEDYLSSPDFLVFQEKKLSKAACDAVEEYLKPGAKYAKSSQLRSIQGVIQAAGFEGLSVLTKHQAEKNSDETNKEFWKFVRSLLDDTGTKPHPLGPQNVVREELLGRGVLASEGTDKTEAKRIRKENRKVVEQVIGICLDRYFEHFICHYLYKTNTTGGAA